MGLLFSFFLFIGTLPTILFPFRWYLVTVGKATVVPAVMIARNTLISPSHFTGSI